jgi:hypothetical protein
MQRHASSSKVTASSSRLAQLGRVLLLILLVSPPPLEAASSKSRVFRAIAVSDIKDILREFHDAMSSLHPETAARLFASAALVNEGEFHGTFAEYLAKKNHRDGVAVSLTRCKTYTANIVADWWQASGSAVEEISCTGSPARRFPPRDEVYRLEWRFVRNGNTWLASHLTLERELGQSAAAPRL